MFRTYHFITYIILSAALPMIFNAQVKANEAELKIMGNILVPPPCKIHQGSVIEVNFEKVGVNTIKGTEQKREVNYQIECGENKNNWQMYLSLSGTKSDFDFNALETNIDNLAVKFQLNDNFLDLDKKYPIDDKSPGTLWAVLVKNGNAKLATGNFLANGTLLVEYQ